MKKSISIMMAAVLAAGVRQRRRRLPEREWRSW